MSVGQLELAQHGRHVSLHRLHRQEQPTGDLLVGVAAGDQSHHLALPRREAIEVGIARGVWALHRLVAGEGVEHEAGKTRREHGVAAVNAADRSVEVGGRDRLGDVAPGTGTNDPDHIVRSVGNREGEEPGRQLVGGDAFDDRPSAAARQVDIEENDVWASSPDDLYGVLDGSGLADDVDRLARWRHLGR